MCLGLKIVSFILFYMVLDGLIWFHNVSYSLIWFYVALYVNGDSHGMITGH